jgi:hypothetical protein
MKILLGALFLVTVVTGCNSTCPQGARPASDFASIEDISSWCPSDACLTGNYTATGALPDGGTSGETAGVSYIQCYTTPTNP